ncbi:uncharacterized protein LOC116968035 [Amblyraja radiata]|uniref:uncharacterized protein LOC116968035 n=1 Tax=Amblyraja radiata TaxID=386614 RepID=UPI0014027B25|nr:uncharacterized protein LOC116968035 [Amblyraja radiata]
MIIALTLTTCCLVLRAPLGQCAVWQSPSSVRAITGGMVELSCWFDEPAILPRLAAFTWELPWGRVYRLEPGGKAGGSTGQRATVHANLNNRSSSLVVSAIAATDTGHYRCVVQLLEPLPIVTMEGAGTWLQVAPASPGVTAAVSQSPAHLLVVEGDPVNLTCTLRTSTVVERMNFIWRWGRSTITCVASPNDSHSWPCDPRTDPKIRITTDLQTKSSQLRIAQVSHNDSRTYQCEVVIIKPQALGTITGNGSRLQVVGGVDGWRDDHSDVRLLPVNRDVDPTTTRLEGWTFTLVLSTVTVTLAAGLGYSCWMARGVSDRRPETTVGSGDTPTPGTHGCWAAGQDPRIA